MLLTHTSTYTDSCLYKVYVQIQRNFLRGFDFLSPEGYNQDYFFNIQELLLEKVHYTIGPTVGIIIVKKKKVSVIFIYPYIEQELSKWLPPIFCLPMFGSTHCRDNFFTLVSLTQTYYHQMQSEQRCDSKPVCIIQSRMEAKVSRLEPGFDMG